MLLVHYLLMKSFSKLNRSKKSYTFETKPYVPASPSAPNRCPTNQLWHRSCHYFPAANALHELPKRTLLTGVVTELAIMPQTFLSSMSNELPNRLKITTNPYLLVQKASKEFSWNRYTKLLLLLPATITRIPCQHHCYPLLSPSYCKGSDWHFTSHLSDRHRFFAHTYQLSSLSTP